MAKGKKPVRPRPRPSAFKATRPASPPESAPAPVDRIEIRLRRRKRVLYVTDFHVDDVLMGIVEHAREAGWELHANMRFHGLFPPVAEADGIIATATGTRGRDVPDWLAAQKNCPIVRMLGANVDLPYPAAETDYDAAGRAGARHLLELGRVHYALYWGESITETRELQTGFVGELATVGQRVHLLDFQKAHSGGTAFRLGPEVARRWLADELKRLPTPIAIMTDDDRNALQLLDACDMAGLRVPEDAAILGCDNRPVEVGLASVPLSSVDMNFKGLGRESAALLDRLMRGEKVSAEVIKVPPIGVVARRSTATFVTDSPGITAAVLFLREHFREPLRIAQLARLAGMSQRTFQSEFKRRVGRTAREELKYARLACAARMLRDTDLKLEALALASGFGSAAHLCRFFVEEYNVSPNVWRQQAKATLIGP